jgi:hypothetical protein
VDRSEMSFVRTIMVLVIALSLAMLPTAGSAALRLAAKAQGTSVDMPDEMAMPSEMSAAMHDCCPEHAKSESKDHSSQQCPMACCAVQLVSIADAAAFRLDFPIAVGTSLPIPVDQIVALNSSSPPFRPPRA